MEGLTKEDYDRFRRLGFDLVKSSMGKYYILPCCRTGTHNHEDILKANAIAQKAGFAFDMNGNVLGFIRPKETDGSEKI